MLDVTGMFSSYCVAYIVISWDAGVRDPYYILDFAGYISGLSGDFIGRWIFTDRFSQILYQSPLFSMRFI